MKEYAIKSSQIRANLIELASKHEDNLYNIDPKAKLR